MAERKTHAACAREKDDLLSRLKRIEGQIRGIYKMVEDDRYCVDVIQQVSAATAALNKVSLALLERHTKSCVTDAIHEGNGEESVRELMEVVKKMIG